MPWTLEAPCCQLYHITQCGGTHGSLTSLSVSLMMRLGRDIVGEGLLREEEVVYVGIDSVSVQEVDAGLFTLVKGDSIMLALV
jgi:hypothetical protein